MYTLKVVLLLIGCLGFCALLVGSMKLLDWFEAKYPETYRWTFIVSATVYMAVAVIDGSYYTFSPLEMTILLFTAGTVVVHSIVWRGIRKENEECSCKEQCARTHVE